MTTVEAHIGKDHYKTVLRNHSMEMIADEPLESGGADLGFSPSDLLCAALAACTSATLRMYADRKGWPLDAIDVTVTFERNAEKTESFMKRGIVLHGLLDETQKSRLLQIANRCNIHNTLTAPITISTTLAESPGNP